MNYEEKYRQALERATKLAFTGNISAIVAGEIFPELKESEDERIRKEIVQFLQLQHPQFVGKRNYEEWITWLEKQGEQKPVDASETKFKVGDWIVTPNGETKQIEKVTFGNYYFTDKTLYNIIDTDNKGHLWTIQDAKDGDMLANGDWNMVLIFKCFKEPSYKQHIIAHIGLDSSGDIQVTDGYWNLGFDCEKPATKEQCDLLFQKMKEAGYEWDAEKKELRKIEQKPSWSEEDEKIRKDLITYINSIKGDTLDLTMRASKWLCWLEKQKEQKQIIAVDSDQLLKILPRTVEWSEEDEKIMKRIDSLLYSQCTIHGSEYESIHNWLKSLKPNHWKPSEEQMSMLLAVLNDPNNITSESVYIALKLLYNDLKKL